MKTVKNTAAQGDVVMRRLKGFVQHDQCKTIAKGRCVLAHGESGHSHVVEDDEAELIQEGERILLRLGRATTVLHEEHKPVKLSPGIWEIGRVREHDYFAQMTRPVQD